MGKRSKPRRGSLQYWPRKRTARIYTRVSFWPVSAETKPLGFAGWKAGMTHVQYTDNTAGSPTFGKTVSKAATIIDAPSLFVIAARFYKKTVSGLKGAGEQWADKIPDGIELKRKTFPGKKAATAAFDDVRLLVCTQPEKGGMNKKKPEVFELGIGGSADRKKEYALSVLGKEMIASDVFKAGDFVDASAVTKGHGFTGVVKRFGVRLGTRKSKQAHRHTGSIGPTTPSHVMHTVPLPGQYGFFKRTEFNKRIIMIDDDAKKINARGGLLDYGMVPKTFMLIEGSVPGTKKRLIRLRKAVRTSKISPVDVKYISVESKQGA